MKLSNANIAQVVEDNQRFLQKAKISDKDRLKIQLATEEIFLRWQEYFGEDTEFEITKRDWFGIIPKILIRIKGDAYNPLETPENDDLAIFSAEVMRNILTYENADIIYSYKNGYNEITIFAPKERKHIKLPGGSITISILIAIAASIIVGYFPQNLQTFIVNDLAIPLLDTLMKLIVAITIPTVFISVVSSICVMEDISTLSNIGFKIIRRFIFLMLLVVAVSTFACSLFFPVLALTGDINTISSEIIKLILSAIPTSIFKPFIEGNILQVVMIAFLTSVCIIILGNKVENLKVAINEVKLLLFKMMELILKVIPLTIFLSIFKAVMTTSMAKLLVVWKIVAASYITYISIAVLMLAYIKIKYKISITDFIKKNSEVFIISITMLSGTASMMVNFDVCKKKLNIDPNLCDFWIPLSHTLFSPGTVNTFVTCAFMGAVASNDVISIMDLFLIAFLAVQLSIVTPKVYGGAIAGFTILLTSLEFSTDVIGSLMIADVFVINLSSLFGMVARNCELFDLSHQVTFAKAST